MAFGKRLVPPAMPPETADGAALSVAPDSIPALPLADRLEKASLEFSEVLIEAFEVDLPGGDKAVHRNTVAAVAAAVAGEMAVRATFTERALDSMPATLPVGAADGFIYANVGRGEETLFDQLLTMARKRIPSDLLPNPRILAQRLSAGTGLSVPDGLLPHVNPLTAMELYGAIAMKIAEREGFDRKNAMLMAGATLILLLRDEKDDDHLVMLMRMSLELMLHSARVNPRKRDGVDFDPARSPESDENSG